MKPLTIYIGFDSREPLAWSVMAHSILKRATQPIAIVPLTLQSLRREYTRERKSNEATEFSLSRFLVPYLSNYEGFSIFCDSDMLCLADIGDVMLHTLADPGRALYVCHHDYIPKALTKFDGHEQTKYPRKNHSSFMVFDNAKCKALTPDYVNTASGLDLHRFHWLDGDHQVGELPLTWNWLVGEYAPNPSAQILHFTNGGPWHAEAEYGIGGEADLWRAEYRDMLGPARAVEQALQRVTV